MANPLTWHNVGHPSLGDPTQALSVAQRAFDGGFKNLSDATSTLQKNQTDAATKLREAAESRIAARFVKLQDPNEQARAMARGEVVTDEDAPLAKSDFLLGLLKHQTTATENGQERIKFTDSQRVQREDDKYREAMNIEINGVPLGRMLEDAARTGNRDMMDRVMDVAAKAGAPLPALDRHLTAAYTRGTAGKTFAESEHDYGTKLEKEAIDKEAAALVSRVRSGGDESTWLPSLAAYQGELASQNKAVDPRVLEAANTLLGGKLYGFTAPATTSGGTSNVAALGGLEELNVPFGGNTFIQKPDNYSNMPLGEVYKLGTQLREKTKAAGHGVLNGTVVGTGAQGLFQMIPASMERAGKAVFGDDWVNQPFNAENQTKMAEFLFNEAKSKNVPMNKVWAGVDKLPPEHRKLVMEAKTFDEASAYLLAAEHGKPVESVRTLLNAARAATPIAEQQKHNPQNFMTKVLIEKNGVSRSPDEVVKEYKAANPDRAHGWDDAEMRNKVNEVMAAARTETGIDISADVAMQVIANNMSERVGLSPWQFDALGGSKFYIDREGIASTLKQLPAAHADMATQSARNKRAEAVDTGSQQLEIAAKELERARTLYESSGGRVGGQQLKTAQDKFNKLTATVSKAVTGVAAAAQNATDASNQGEAARKLSAAASSAESSRNQPRVPATTAGRLPEKASETVAPIDPIGEQQLLTLRSEMDALKVKADQLEKQGSPLAIKTAAQYADASRRYQAALAQNRTAAVRMNRLAAMKRAEEREKSKK